MPNIIPSATPDDTNPTALTPERLAEIKADRVHAQQVAGLADWPLAEYQLVRQTFADMATLLAEVERLRAELATRPSRTEVLREVLGDDLNPSNLVLDAQAYRTLADAISATMADPNEWDGDDSEEEILARYVRWLAAEQRNAADDAKAEPEQVTQYAVGVQYPNGEAITGVTDSRTAAEVRLADVGIFTSGTPSARLLTRTATYTPWTEATS